MVVLRQPSKKQHWNVGETREIVVLCFPGQIFYPNIESTLDLTCDGQRSNLGSKWKQYCVKICKQELSRLTHQVKGVGQLKTQPAQEAAQADPKETFTCLRGTQVGPGLGHRPGT